MAIHTVREFFYNKNFIVPKYQRSYSWDSENVRDLIEDLLEAISANSKHYIGTIVLSKTQINNRTYNIVDGQQRTTTLTIFINELIKRLEKSDRDFYNRIYIKDNDYKLAPQNADREFFYRMIEGDSNLQAISSSQGKLLTAKRIINESLDNFRDYKKILDTIEDLQMMEFIQESDGDAIRIFQTVNDRGKVLSNMEKIKSLLIYYSNRFLNGSMDDEINNLFGEMFENFDTIKHLSERFTINLISNKKFTEDNILRYHFISFAMDDYDASPEYVLKWIKNKLEASKNDTVSLKEFLVDYTHTLSSFFSSLDDLIGKIDNNYNYLKYFSVLEFNTNLYPLLISLNQLNLLDTPISNGSQTTLIQLILSVDIRVYKIRGTDPRADLSRFVFRLHHEDLPFEDIILFIKNYITRWMNENEFRANLNTNVYDRFRSILPFVFLEYSESLGTTFNFLDLLNKIKDKDSSLTIEHILAQHPTFDLTSYGFEDEEDYSLTKHYLGNLTLIEKNLNSSAKDKNPFEKISIYDRSSFKITTELATYISMKTFFNKRELMERTDSLIQFIFHKYSLD
jgi:uncharacterized protein with ParB-like and HNH nuclease domain